MAYFNGYPVSYQPVYQQQTQQTGVIWVSGEQAAKSYLVAPNSTVVLFDSEAQAVYLKSADASGMPSMRILDYTIRDQTKNGANNPVIPSDDKLSTFATKDEIKAVSERINALRERLDKMEVKDE